MRKEEFFDKLEYLLQDIPDQDREDALDYYRDYLAEAGSGNEEAAIEDFGSPERVAAIIRADLAGNLNDGGSFTDRGYEDERFRDPGYQVAKRLDLPEERKNTAGSGSGRGYEKDGWQTGPSQMDWASMAGRKRPGAGTIMNRARRRPDGCARERTGTTWTRKAAGWPLDL